MVSVGAKGDRRTLIAIRTVRNPADQSGPEPKIRRRRLTSAFAAKGPSLRRNRPRRPLATALTHSIVEGLWAQGTQGDSRGLPGGGRSPAKPVSPKRQFPANREKNTEKRILRRVLPEHKPKKLAVSIAYKNISVATEQGINSSLQGRNCAAEVRTGNAADHHACRTLARHRVSHSSS
jgi:hypothetical protein